MPGVSVMLGHAAGAVVVVCPIASGEIGIGYGGAGIGGVNELSVARVDAHMGNAACVCTGEENDITGLQICLGDGGTHVVLIGGGAVGRIAKLLQNIVHIAGTVKTGRGGAAVYIAGAQVFLCLSQNLRTGDTGNGGHGTAAGGCTAGQGCRTGGNTGGFTAPVELGGIGGFLILVGDFGQFHKIAADIADGGLIDDLIPAVIYTKNIALAALGGNSNTAVGGAGTGTDINTVSSDLAIAKFCIFALQHIQIVFVHPAFLEIVVDLVPVAGFGEDNNTVMLGCGVQNFGIGGGITAQTQVIGIDKSDAVHGFAGCAGTDSAEADKENGGQHQVDESLGKIHKLPPVMGSIRSIWGSFDCSVHILTVMVL